MNQTHSSVQDRLLLMAREQFARHGYDGASVRGITSRARANLGAITYHFGSKRHLYTAVIESIIGPLAARVKDAARADAPALDTVEAIVRVIFAHIKANPDMPIIVVREMVGGREVAAPVRRMMGEMLPLLAGIIAAGQRGGTIRAGDPLLLALSTIAQPVYLNLARHAIAATTGIDATDPRVVDHAVAVVRAALEP